MTSNNVDRHDDTSDAHHQFERRQLAQDRDRRAKRTSDLTSSEVREVVEDLIEAGTVTVDSEMRRLIHCPTGVAFTSRSALAHFHLGWASNDRQ